MKFTPRDGAIRFYDSTVTPYYIDLDFDEADFSGPLGQPTPEEILYLHRGKMDANAHYVKGPDDPMMAPVPLTLSLVLTDSSNTQYVLEWLRACNDGATTTVGVSDVTIVTTKADTQRNGANANPAFVDTNKLCFNVEFLYNTSGTDILFSYNECYAPLDQATINEAADGTTLSLNLQCYGTILYTPGGSFTAGTDSEA